MMTCFLKDLELSNIQWNHKEEVDSILKKRDLDIPELLKEQLAQITIRESLDLSEELKKKFLQQIRRNESYRSRINFHTFNSVLKFEKDIYFKNMFHYEHLKFSNPDIVSDFSSSVLSLFIKRGFVSKDFRKYIDQYFVSMMAGLDYFYYSHPFFLDEDIEGRRPDRQFVYIMGLVPRQLEDYYLEIVGHRIELASRLYSHPTSPRPKLILKSNHFFESVVSKYKGKCDISKQHLKQIGGEFTKDNIERIFGDLPTVADPWELILVCSTHGLIRVASELNKHLEMNKSSLGKLSRIKLYGAGNIYDLMNPEEDGFCPAAETMSMELIELKLLLFELYKHALDKNNEK